MSAFTKLDSKHQLVVAHFRANGRNQTVAWISAGYEARSARASSSRFFARPDVQAALEELDGQVIGKLKVDADGVLQRLAQIMHGNMADFVAIDGAGKVSLALAKVNRDQWAAVSQVKIAPDGAVTLKLYDARAAAVDLGKHLGLFRQKLADLLDPVDADDLENTPERDSARQILLAFALRVGGGKPAAKSAVPIKH